MVLDQWLHPRIALAKHPLAECRALLVDGSHLRRSFTEDDSIYVCAVLVPPSRHLGSLPGSTHRPPQTNPRSPSGRHHHGVDDRCVEQQRIVDIELAAALAGLVSRRIRAPDRPRWKP